MKTIILSTLAIFISSTSLVACGGSSAEPKTPEERIAEDEAELEDMEKHSMGSGSELEAEAVERDMQEAEEELEAEEAAADAE